MPPDDYTPRGGDVFIAIGAYFAPQRVIDLERMAHRLASSLAESQNENRLLHDMLGTTRKSLDREKRRTAISSQIIECQDRIIEELVAVAALKKELVTA
jgi:hypothetical protein